jgi:hypothetical protein
MYDGECLSSLVFFSNSSDFMYNPLKYIVKSLSLVISQCNNSFVSFYTYMTSAIESALLYKCYLTLGPREKEGTF